MAKKGRKQQSHITVSTAGNEQKSKAFKNIVLSQWRQTRYDIEQWRNAWKQALNIENPNPVPLYNIYKDYEIDAHWISQTSNFEDSVTEGDWQFADKSGEPNVDLTKILYEQGAISNIIKDCVKTTWNSHFLYELGLVNNKLIYEILPQKHVRAKRGLFLINENDEKGFKYRELFEYGKTLIEYGNRTDLGLLNAAMPHLIMKRFAQSCWSEYCEIFGMPIRTLKTNTSDAKMLDAAERMMREMSTAAYVIIDETEEMIINNSNTGDGAVYEKLIKLCKDELSLLVSGAIMGQDTQFGTRGKEEQSSDIFGRKITSTKSNIERWINSDLVPAMVYLKYIPDGFSFNFVYEEDTDALFDKTVKLLPYYEVEDYFIINKFGIKVTGKRVNNVNF